MRQVEDGETVTEKGRKGVRGSKHGAASAVQDSRRGWRTALSWPPPAAPISGTAEEEAEEMAEQRR